MKKYCRIFSPYGFTILLYNCLYGNNIGETDNMVNSIIHSIAHHIVNFCGIVDNIFHNIFISTQCYEHYCVQVGNVFRIKIFYSVVGWNVHISTD